MKMWHIEKDNIERAIDVGPVTILKGSHSEWYKIARAIDDFFNNKKTEVVICEDTQLLHPKDWECLFIPFDAHVQLDKLNSKSPLKILLEDICNELSMSPIYHELQDVWENLREEIKLVQSKLNHYELSLEIKDFQLENLKDFLFFYPMNKMMTPVQFKKLLLKVFTNKKMEKKRLIILELPEIYANLLEKTDLKNEVECLSKKGNQFIIVTQENYQGNINFILNEIVINGAMIEEIKRKVLNEVPFYCEEQLFEEAKKRLFEIVDNSPLFSDSIELSTTYTEKLDVLLFVIAKQLGIKVKVDVSGISPNLVAYIKSYT